MSLDVRVYTFDEEGQRQRVRGIDWRSIQKEWQGRTLSKEERDRAVHQLLVESESWRTIAGPEVWRTKVYGSQEARSLVLTLLPSLSEGDIDVQGEELNRLGEGINLLIQNVALFAAISPPTLAPSLKEVNEGMLFCFTNIAKAVVEAKGLNGGVEIE